MYWKDLTHLFVSLARTFCRVTAHVGASGSRALMLHSWTECLVWEASVGSENLPEVYELSPTYVNNV